MPILTLSSTTPTAGGSGAAGTFAHVGTDVKSPFNPGTTVNSLKFTSLNVGDVVFAIVGGGNGSATAIASAVGSPNTTGWEQVAGPCFDSTFGGGCYIWMGTVVNPTVNDVLSVTWSANSSTSYITIVQFHPTVTQGPPVYTVDQVGAQRSGTGTTATWPSLTPTGVGELYFGACAQGGTPSGGSTAGFTYGTDSATNQFLYDPIVATVQAPTATQTSGSWETIALLLQVFASAATLNGNTVTLQQVPAGLQWIVSQIGYEILPLYTPGTGVPVPTVNVTMNQRALYSGVNGNGGSNQGPPYVAVRPGDNLTVTWSNAPIGASCIANFFYTEYDATVTPSEIGNVV